MKSVKCPKCGKDGVEYTMFMGYNYSDCCNEQLELEMEA